MRPIRKNWVIALALAALPAAGCVGQDQLVGSDGSNVGAPSFGGGTSHSVSYTVLGPLNFAPGKCLPDPLRDEASCKMLTTRSGSACSCSEPGLAPTTSAVSAALAEQLRLVAYCGREGLPACTDYCACEIPRASRASTCKATASVAVPFTRQPWLAWFRSASGGTCDFAEVPA